MPYEGLVKVDRFCFCLPLSLGITLCCLMHIGQMCLSIHNIVFENVNGVFVDDVLIKWKSHREGSSNCTNNTRSEAWEYCDKSEDVSMIYYMWVMLLRLGSIMLGIGGVFGLTGVWIPKISHLMFYISIMLIACMINVMCFCMAVCGAAVAHCSMVASVFSLTMGFICIETCFLLYCIVCVNSYALPEEPKSRYIMK